MIKTKKTQLVPYHMRNDFGTLIRAYDFSVDNPKYPISEIERKFGVGYQQLRSFRVALKNDDGKLKRAIEAYKNNMSRDAKRVIESPSDLMTRDTKNSYHLSPDFDDLIKAFEFSDKNSHVPLTRVAKRHGIKESRFHTFVHAVRNNKSNIVERINIYKKMKKQSPKTKEEQIPVTALPVAPKKQPAQRSLDWYILAIGLCNLMVLIHLAVK